MPEPNAPVFLIEPSPTAVSAGAVGHFPGTSYPVTLDLDQLVTHNTAILGVLGVGKSYLGFEVVERLIAGGCKVLCLDLTDEYAQHLAPFYDKTAHDEATELLRIIGQGGKQAYNRNMEDGGSLRDFREQVQIVLSTFFEDETWFRTFNPSEFEVWRQDSRQYPDGRAAMASLTPPEITQVFVEELLVVMQKHGTAKSARCCVVLEEAHALAPERSAVVTEGDKAAANGTARAILQGRKFGLGCLVITQRTANVTKSILNQCNTVFALRIFDATGMEFLKNYVGEDYSADLSTLKDREAVLFGRASSCSDPVLIRLNDRADFLRRFRSPEGGGPTKLNPV